MKIKLHGIKNIYIKGEYIKLDALLKFQSIASTGGEAKYLIQSGEIFVNGEPCTIRGKKIKLGDIVRYDDKVLHIKRKNI
jgi:ribosome-associated protein